MQDTFWTPELWCEFLNQLRPELQRLALYVEMEQFKQSKSPKKEWEIVAYHFKPLLKHYDKAILVRPGSPKWDDAKQDSEDYDIHSVRRLSDGLLVSCEDWVDVDGWGKCKITGFKIEGKTMRIAGNGCFLLLEYVKGKLPQPILVTHDGKELFNGDKYWHVNEDWTLSVFSISTEWCDYSDGPKNDFSTRSAAEAYILNHKPVLSLNDVREAYGTRDSIGTTYLMETLTELVKEKIK